MLWWNPKAYRESLRLLLRKIHLPLGKGGKKKLQLPQCNLKMDAKLKYFKDLSVPRLYGLYAEGEIIRLCAIFTCTFLLALAGAFFSVPAVCAYFTFV